MDFTAIPFISAWSKYNARGQHADEIGVEFLNLSRKDQSRIKQQVNTMSQSSYFFSS